MLYEEIGAVDVFLWFGDFKVSTSNAFLHPQLRRLQTHELASSSACRHCFARGCIREHAGMGFAPKIFHKRFHPEALGCSFYNRVEFRFSARE